MGTEEEKKNRSTSFLCWLSDESAISRFFCSIILSNKSKSIPFFSWRLYEFCVCVFFHVIPSRSHSSQCQSSVVRIVLFPFRMSFFSLFNASCLRNSTMWLLVHARQLKLIEKKEHRICPNSLFLFVGGSFTLHGPFFCLRCLSLSGSHICFSIPSAEEWRREKKWNEPKPSRQMQTIVATSTSRGDCFPLAISFDTCYFSLYTCPTEIMFICDFFFLHSLNVYVYFFIRHPEWELFFPSMSFTFVFIRYMNGQVLMMNFFFVAAYPHYRA